ncbi:MAG: ankyrin repeat domain-containing protein, partial [Pseudomonadota bacterium]
DIALKFKRHAIFAFYLYKMPSILDNVVNGLNLIHRVAKFGNNEMMKLIIGEGVDLNSTSEAGYTALHFACQLGDVNLAYLLIENNANINVKDNWGNCPIHKAVINNHVDVVIMLSAIGADTKIANINGKTIFDYHTNGLMKQVLYLLASNSLNKSSFFYNSDKDKKPQSIINELNLDHKKHSDYYA